MTLITAPSPTNADPDAIDALPGQAPVQQPATGPRPGGRDGPLRNGNPRGNPHLAPRCGAKARRTGCACRAPAMANGRCRSHGGKSTGPRTAEGRASVGRAHTTHGKYTQATLGTKDWVHTRYCRVMARRFRLAQALTRHLRWLPRALAERVRAFDVPELRAPARYTQFQDAPPEPSAPGPTPYKAGRDARGRFAAPPAPALRGRKAELAWARAEAAALAPWKAALKRARMIRRLMKSQDRKAGRAKPGRGPLHGLRSGPCPSGMPPGACPGGGTVRPGGAACEGSDTNSMNSGAGGGTAGGRAEAQAVLAPPAALIRAAALVHGRGVPFEGSDTESMNSGAGGGTAGRRAEASAVLAPPAAVVRAAGLVHRRGAPFESSDTNSLNSGAGGGTAGRRAEASAVLAPPAAAVRAAALVPGRGAPFEGSDIVSLNSGAGGGTAASDAALAALPNRAARRRWKSLQRRKHVAPKAIG